MGEFLLIFGFLVLLALPVTILILVLVIAKRGLRPMAGGVAPDVPPVGPRHTRP